MNIEVVGGTVVGNAACAALGFDNLIGVYTDIFVILIGDNIGQIEGVAVGLVGNIDRADSYIVLTVIFL